MIEDTLSTPPTANEAEEQLEIFYSILIENVAEIDKSVLANITETLEVFITVLVEENTSISYEVATRAMNITQLMIEIFISGT